MATPCRVLVVDDDENLGQIIAEVLTAAGYDVQTADDGLHGFRMYLQQQPQVVLTDIQLPELDGLEMMRCIRAINPAVKTMYISGAVNQYGEALAKEREDYGALVLDKPFSRNNLLQCLGSWLGESIEYSVHG